MSANQSRREVLSELAEQMRTDLEDSDYRDESNDWGAGYRAAIRFVEGRILLEDLKGGGETPRKSG
jgi:hypothetical protein